MATTLLKNARVLLLGGGGMVGSTIAKHLCRLPPAVRPSQLILAALTQQDAEWASREVQQEACHYPSSSSKEANICVIPVWGDMFVREELAQQTNSSARLRHAMMLEDLYGDFEAAYERSHLVQTFREYQPQIVVDCINTATIVAYRNIFEATAKLQESLGGMQTMMTESSIPHIDGKNLTTIDTVLEDAETVMLAQPAPSLIRHIQTLAKVSEEVGLRQYIKIGSKFFSL